MKPKRLKYKWIKTFDGWACLAANVRARVGEPSGSLGFSHWYVSASGPGLNGASGGTPSVLDSKRAAEREMDRFSGTLTER
jgi:hypothetical protein